jgi:hypothetical protein
MSAAPGKGYLDCLKYQSAVRTQFLSQLLENFEIDKIKNLAFAEYLRRVEKGISPGVFETIYRTYHKCKAVPTERKQVENIAWTGEELNTLEEIVFKYKMEAGSIDWKRVKKDYGTTGRENNKLKRRTVDAMKTRLRKKIVNISKDCGSLNRFIFALKPADLNPEQLAYFNKERRQPSEDV